VRMKRKLKLLNAPSKKHVHRVSAPESRVTTDAESKQAHN